MEGTDLLHKKIDDLRSRVKELEEALTVSHASQSTSVHRLLQPDTSGVATRLPNPVNANDHRLQTEFDVLMLSETGKMQWLGSTALSEWFVKPEPPPPGPPSFDVPPTNPFAMPGQPVNPDNLIFAADTLSTTQVNEYRQIVINALPDEAEFLRLTNLYYEQVGWFYNPVPRKRLQQIASPLYTGIPDRVEGHELSSVFTILALGLMMDPTRPPDHPTVTRYSNYGKLCLSLECIFGQTSIATIEANLLRLIFLLFSRDRAAPMKAFGQLGLIGRLIISMGMHRDPARWNFDEEECTRRRRLFWEYLAFDTWQCLGWGRPSSVVPGSYDCKIPWDRPGELEGEEPRFQRWKFIYIRDILLDVLMHSTTCGAPPTLGTVMKLDKRIRSYELLDAVTSIEADSTQPAQAIVYQRNIMFCIKESALAFLHRPFFVSALNENHADPLRSRFAGSVLAVHASASALLGRSKVLLDFQPHVPRFFVWWTQAFSAVVSLGALVIRAPGSTLAASALTEINMTAEAFERAKEGFRAGRLLPSVLKIQTRATLAVQAFRAGQVYATNEDTTDILPGIVAGPVVISNAIFPTASEHCALTGTFSLSNEPTPPSQPHEAVDNMVNTYLANLQSELADLSRQRGLTNWSDTAMQQDQFVPNAFAQGVQGQQFFPPTTELLPAPPPLLTESHSMPAFDPALWTGFMAQFGGGYA